MSLTDRERAATAREIAANLELSGLTLDQLGELTGLGRARLEAALAVTQSRHPADVWLVRDAVEAAAKDAGSTPVPYSVLTDEMRGAAERWFGYR